MANEHIKTIAKGAGIFFVGMFVSKIFTYLYRLIIARGLGPDAYGVFSLCFAVISMVSALTIFGLPNAIERYVPYHKADKSKVRGIIFFTLQIGLITGFAAMIILFFLSSILSINVFNNPQILDPLKIFLLSIPALSILTLYESISRAFKKVEYPVYTRNIIYSVINLIAAGVSVYFGFGIIGIAYGFLISVLISLVCIFILVEQVANIIFDKTKPSFIRKEIMNFSWPLTLAGMFGLIIGWIDTIFLGYFMNETYVGLYNSAIPTVNLLLVIPSAVISILVPTTAELLSKQKMIEIKQSFLICSEWVFFINFPVFLVFILYPQQILNILFGSAYTAAGTAFVILSIGFFMFSIIQPALKLLELLTKTRFYLVITASAAALNIILNVLLIPLYGINGAAIASAASFILLFAIVLIKTSLIEKYQIISINFVKSGATAAILLFVLYFGTKLVLGVITPLMLIPLVCAYFGIYVLVLYLFILRKEEKELIYKLKASLRLKAGVSK